MVRVAFSTLITGDTEEILTNLAAKAGSRVATRYNELFERVYRRLGDYPDSGAPRPTLGKDIRIAMAAPFIIIYHQAEHSDFLTVLRVVDGRRRITRKLLPYGPLAH